MKHSKKMSGIKNYGWNKMLLLWCVMIAIMACTGCSLAREERDAGQLIGAMVTKKMLPEEKIYAKVAKDEEGELQISFAHVEGAYFIAPITEDAEGESVIGNECSDGVYDMKLELHVVDDKETLVLNATLYGAMEPEEKGRFEFYVNPIYQTEDYKVYVRQGTGSSMNVEPEEEATCTQSLSESLETVLNGKKQSGKIEINVAVTKMDIPKNVRISQLDAEDHLIKTEDYAVEEIPEKIKIQKKTDYFVVTTMGEGIEQNKKEIFQYDGETQENTIHTYQLSDTGWIGKKEIEVRK